MNAAAGMVGIVQIFFVGAALKLLLCYLHYALFSFECHVWCVCAKMSLHVHVCISNVVNVNVINVDIELYRAYVTCIQDFSFK